MPRVTLIAGKFVAETELARSSAENLQILEGCAAQALSGLTPKQKEQLRSRIFDVRASMETGIEIMQRRRTRLSKRVILLRKELGEVGTDSSQVTDFIRLLRPAIQSCPDVSAVASEVKAVTDRTNSESLEIEYRLLLVTTQQSLVEKRLAEGRAALAALDDLNTAIR